jgi:hypothetical protein
MLLIVISTLQDIILRIFLMPDSKPQIDLKPRLHPLLASLPEHLKNPANFEKIQKAIIDTLQTKCNHGDVLEFAKCKKCTENMLKRRLLLRKLGFRSPSQYFAWRSIHEEIKKRYPLIDWKKENLIRQSLENAKIV